MDYKKLNENIISNKIDIFFVPYAFLNVEINKFLEEEIGGIKSISLTPQVEFESGTFTLSCENVQLFTDTLKSGSTIIFKDFIIPGNLKTKIKLQLNTKKLSQDTLIKFEVVIVNFNKEFLNTLPYKKINQKAKFEIEHCSIYTRDSSNIIQHSIKKVYKECDILFQNKSIRKTLQED